MSLKQQLFRKHTPQYFNQYNKDASRSLERTLKWYDISIIAISICIGAGIFSVGAKVIVYQAGPAAIISFLIAATVCAFAAMCYAEFASLVPVSGSSYIYSYASMGEIVAWIIGWNMILELFLAVSVVLKYWCVYLFDFIRMLGVETVNALKFSLFNYSFSIDWPIIVFGILMIILQIKGTNVSTKVASIFVVLKMIVIVVIIVWGAFYFKAENLHPFIPPAQTSNSADLDILSQTLFSYLLGQSPQQFGIFGILAGAGIIFFAFAGFDASASVAEETINPKRNVPLGLMVGVVLVAIVYVLIGIVTAGMVPLNEYINWLNLHPEQSVSLTTAFEIVGNKHAGALISFGIFVGLTSVLLMGSMSLSRIVFAISRDGLLPRWLSRTSKRHHTPHRIIIVLGVLFIITALFASVDLLSEMVNIGTLSAFAVVSFAVVVFRKKEVVFNDEKSVKGDKNSNSFKVPFFPVAPILSGVFCIWLSLQLAIITWIYFIFWLLIGFTIYFCYGYKHSMLNKYQNSGK